MSSPATAHGIRLLCAGVFVFSLQDAVVKQVSGDYPLTQVVTIRCLVALPILLVLVQLEAGWRAIVSKQFRALIARAGIMFLSYTFYYMAFPAMNLAYAVALYFTVPLFVTALAGPFLGEHIGGKAWMALAAGFGGVLVILQPGSGLFEWAALLSLLAALMYATSMLMARRLGSALRDRSWPSTRTQCFWRALWSSACAPTGWASRTPATPASPSWCDPGSSPA